MNKTAETRERPAAALPDKLSELLRVALDDLEHTEGAKGVMIDMGWYHDVLGDKCVVCLAGCVMRESLGALDSKDYTTSDFGESRGKLRALDALANGSVSKAVGRLNNPEDARPADLSLCHLDREVPRYECDRDGFKLALRELADCLEANGL